MDARSGPTVPQGPMATLVSMLLSAAVLVAAPSGEAAAQVRAPQDGGRIHSLGQPGPWDFHLGASVGGSFPEGSSERFQTLGQIGVYRDLLGIPLSVVGLEGNAYAGAVGSEMAWGFQGLVMSPLFRLGVGVDYSGVTGETHPLVSVVHPVRRGGIVGFGTALRIDYLPTRDHAVSLGMQLPIGRSLPMGRTRPRHGAVRLSTPLLDPVPFEAPAPELEEALARAAEASHWIHRYTVPFLEHPGWTSDEGVPALIRELEALQAHAAEARRRTPGGAPGAFPGEGGYARELRIYHEEIERAFSIAVSGRPLPPGMRSPEGSEMARRAREVLLHEVLLPYDRLLGQRKDEDTTLPFASRARGIFIRWLHTDATLPDARLDDVFRVFVRLLDIVEENRRQIAEAWGDSRFVWLPLQYALRPEEHATQAQIDALVELAVEGAFTDGNRISYVINEQFDYQLTRMIQATEDYHVLWIHDFPGWNQEGGPDAVAYAQVLDGYLSALVTRVRDYDRTGILPVYMILIDEIFYAARNSRLWMDLLEDPMNHRIQLPRGYEAWEESIERAQEELRRAVSGSRLLQAEAAQYGAEWLRDRVRVHVNVTNRADPSFWIRGGLPLAGMPDGLMRDHRKVSFFDITEDDPYRGRAIYTGMGVGEQYTSLNWEDRSLMIQGRAALGLKTAARELLLEQGVRPDQVPYHLQPRPVREHSLPPRPDGVAWADDARILEVHNQTGYNAKSVNVAKAVLYTLMPPGSVMKIPDSLWNSGFWGGMLLGSSLRGARVLVIAPADRNAPSRGFGQLARARELFARLILAQEILADEIGATGGLLRTGIYATETPVTDFRAKLGAFLAAYEEGDAWFRDLFPLDPTLPPLLRNVYQGLRETGGPHEEEPVLEEPPKLHLKANFLASPEAWFGLISRPELGSYFQVWMEARVAQLQDRELARQFPGFISERLLEEAMPTLTAWADGLPPEERERLVFYLRIGSTNQNYRSMVMDGEVDLVLSGWTSIVGIIDFISLTGQSVWVTDFAQLEALAGELPEYWGWRRWLGNRFRIAL